MYNHKNPPPSSPYMETMPSLTRQEDKDRGDINKIMRKYEKIGVLPTMNREAFFADVTKVTSYQEAYEIVRNGDEFFEQLPAEFRARFQNDAAAFLDFTSNPQNRSELIELGLLEADEVVTTNEPGSSGGDEPVSS